jgi:hypothetical protein
MKPMLDFLRLFSNDWPFSFYRNQPATVFNTFHVMAVASWSLLSCAFSNWEIFYWKMAFSLILFSFFYLMEAVTIIISIRYACLAI